MKRKWWILGGVLAAMVLSLCLFPVRLRLMPRLILSQALGTALEQLEDRFEDSPVSLLAQAIDLQGRQQARLKLETEEKHLGPVVYDMTLLTQMGPNRIQADGSVVTGGKVLDISLFLDENFAAISSRGLLEGRYYGITYETFSRDIRDRQLLATLVGEDLIGEWEGSVASVQEKMALELTLPEFRPEDICAGLYGVLALKPEICREQILLPREGDHKGYVVSFRATGTEISEAAKPYRDQLRTEIQTWIDRLAEDPGSEVTVRFSLCKGKLIQILAQLENAGETYECLLYLGENPEEKTLSLECNVQTGGETKKSSVMIRTEQDEEAYEEVLHFVKTENGDQESTTVKYNWDLSSGDMVLEILRGEKKVEQRLNLTGEGESLTIRSQNIRPLLNFLLDQEKVKPAICTLSVSPGREVTVPKYRNLDQWSGEDLLTLLAGFGGLLGLKLP